MKKLNWPVKYLIIILFYFLLIETLSRAFVWQIKCGRIGQGWRTEWEIEV